jgi:hypothetical protein
MPPKGKKQLSKQEIALIHRWIAKGAPYGPVEIPASGPTLATTPVPALVDSAPDEGDEEREDAAEAVTTESKKTTAKQADIPPADESTVSALRQQGIIIEPTIPGSNALTVNFVNVKKLDPAMFSSLNELRDQVTELKFTGQPVSDENLAALSTFRHLNKLQLDKTAITDKGLESLQKFPTLESLNLYGTEVTDGGVRNLTSCKSLKRVYLWQTGITEQGLKNIKLARPELKTEAGLSTLSKPDSTKKK